MKETLEILIIDDHQLVRDGVKTMLLSQSDKYCFVIAEADCGESGIQKVLEKDFDIILADYQLPDIVGPDMVRRILLQKPNCKILALSSYDEHACVLNMLNAGVKGYVLKNISPSELILAIEAILKGKKYYTKDVAKKVNAIKKKKSIRSSQQEKFGVTKREIEILKLISDGMTNEAISKKLHLAKRTIDVHRQHLLEKLEVHNTAALIKKTTELSLL